jgi:hypothetical protein
MPQRNNDDWTNAWSARYASSGDDAAAPAKRARFRVPFSGRTKSAHVLFSSVLVAMLVTPFAVAQSGSGGGDARIERNDARYAFLARNTRSGDGGAGALACTSNANPAGQTNREPCLNMVNKGTGFAAAFRTRGLTGFRLQTSGEGTATPFLLDPNATGKVEHFNADSVDGLSSEQIRPRFARIAFTAPATVARVEGASNGVTSVSRTGPGRYQVKFDTDISKCALHVTSGAVGQTRTTAAEPLETDNTVADVAIRKADAPNEGDLVDSRFSITANC